MHVLSTFFNNKSKTRLSKKSFVGFHMARDDFVASGRPLCGQKRLAPLAKRSTFSKSKVKLVNEMMQRAYLCVILHVKHKKLPLIAILT